MTTYDKLMAVANDPSATPAERASYRAKAEQLREKELLERARVPAFTELRTAVRNWRYQSQTENSFYVAQVVYTA